MFTLRTFEYFPLNNKKRASHVSVSRLQKMRHGCFLPECGARASPVYWIHCISWEAQWVDFSWTRQWLSQPVQCLA